MTTSSLSKIFVSLLLLSWVQSSEIKTENFLYKSIVPFYLENVFDQWAQLSVDEIKNTIFNGMSKKCQDDTLEWVLQFVNQTKPMESAAAWTFPLIDSWGKPTSGILNTEAIGNYDQCLSVVRTKNGTADGFLGKYCISVIFDKDRAKNQSQQMQGALRGSMKELDTQFSFLFGNCISSTCSTKDAVILIENTLEYFEISNIGIQMLDCFTEHEVYLDLWDIVMLSIIGVLVTLSIISIFFDFSTTGKADVRKNFGDQLIASFSLKRSLKYWLNTKKTYELSSVNGILFLTVAWIILAHSWEMPFLSHYFSWNRIHDLKPEIDYSDWSQLLIRNGDVAMDTLFTVSGLTVAFKLLHELDKFNGKAALCLYIHILLRVTPVYLLVVGFMATLFTFIADGPFSSFIFHASQNCEANGWTNIIYVNNFVNSTKENMCLPDSWYFANEMQFLLLSPLLIYFLWKFSKKGLVILAFLTVGSIVVPGVLTFEHSMPPAAISAQNYDTYFTKFYILPWNRASSFLVGIFFGYLHYTTRKSFKLPKALGFAGWLFSTAIAISIIFGLFPYFDPKRSIPTVEASVYAGLHRFAWGIVISWIIFACSRGYGGWINKFLSWNFFAPLGRVSMIAFLVTLPVQFIHHFRFQETLVSDTYTKINFFVADLVITYLVAILLSLFLGIPCKQIGNIFRLREKDGVEEMRSKKQRNGIYYDREVSICIENKKSRQRIRHGSDNAVQYRHKQRYGIYYDKDVSISMEAKK